MNVEMNVESARRVLRICAGMGAAFSVVFFARALQTGAPWLRLAEALFVVGASVVVPLGVALALPTDRRASRLSWALVALAVPLGGACAGGALLLPGYGVPLALAFFVSTVVCALLGAARFLAWGTQPREELAVDVGLVSLVVSGVWFVVDRSGQPFMGFSGPIVIMTAVHFVFAGFAASVIAGVVGRATTWRRTWGVAAFIVAIGPALVGVGLVASPVVEALAAVALALGMLALGFVCCTLRSKLLGAAGAVLVVTMAFATLFAMRRVAPEIAPSWERMAHFHGVLNALGFALCGMTALTVIGSNGAPSRAKRFGIPVSRFRSTFRVTDTFFLDRGFVNSEREAPRGLVDDMKVFGARAPAIDDEVRAFYEETARHDLVVHPRWQPGWRLGGRLFRALRKPIGQLGLPVDALNDSEMTSSLQALDDVADGRAALGAHGRVRSWSRRLTRSNDTLYAAAYTTHVENGVVYMNIAFPLPLSNMTSILRMDPLAPHIDVSRLADAGSGGLALTTKPSIAGVHRGDEGVYLATPLGALRLPFDETITVWSAKHGGMADSKGASVLAEHTMWIFGVRFLVLDYFLISR